MWSREYARYPSAVDPSQTSRVAYECVSMYEPYKPAAPITRDPSPGFCL